MIRPESFVKITTSAIGHSVKAQLSPVFHYARATTSSDNATRRTLHCCRGESARVPRPVQQWSFSLRHARATIVVQLCIRESVAVVHTSWQKSRRAVSVLPSAKLSQVFLKIFSYDKLHTLARTEHFIYVHIRIVSTTAGHRHR